MRALIGDRPFGRLTLEQLFPDRRSLEPGDAYGDLQLVESAPPDRPYIVANMVVTADGKAAIGGHAAPISNEVDRALFLELRARVDAIMVGTRTIAIERYGPLVKSEERKELRRRRGLDPVPLAVTATRTLELPVDAPLFADPTARIVVLTSSLHSPPASGWDCAATLIVERVGREVLDLPAGMRRLRSAHCVRALLLEGGPTLLGAMTAAGLVDELFLTIAAKLVGDAGELSLLAGGLEQVPLELQSVLAEESYLYLRYKLVRAG